MDQKSINNGSPKTGSTTISDQIGNPNPSPSPTPSNDSNDFVSKPVRSTFQNACDSKKEVKIIKNEDGSRTLLLHSFCIKSASANYDQASQKIRFKGVADFDGFRNLKSFSFDVSGAISKGRGILKAPVASEEDLKQPKFMAAAFCNEQGSLEPSSEQKLKCGSFFIDLYVMVPGFENELFDEQVEDCGQSDQCLSVQENGTSSARNETQTPKKDPDKEKKALPTEPDNKKDGHAPSKTLPKKPDNDPEVPVTPPVSQDLEVNLDNQEEEGADIPNSPTPYIALNTANKIDSLMELFKKKDSDGSGDLFPAIPAEVTAPQDPSVQKDAKPGAKPGKDVPAKKPDVKTPAKPDKKPQPPKVTPPEKPLPDLKPDIKTPTKPDEKTDTTKLPPLGENKTVVPDPEDPTLLTKEFPWNVGVPTRGPMQVHGGLTSGYLVNGTELFEPSEGSAPTFILDKTTKNLKNPNYRKSFGTFYVVDFLKKMTDFTYEVIHGPIRINDLSLPKGGFLPPHTWHRVGLDVDVEYSLIPKDFARAMTAEQKWMIFQRIGASPLVNVIMLDEKDKRAACEIANLRKDHDLNSRIAMQKLKVKPGHTTHFHINFNCTYNSYCHQPEDFFRSQYPQNEGECLAAKKMSPPLMQGQKK